MVRVSRTICLRDGLSRRVVVGTCHCKAAVLVCKSLICDRVSIPPVTGGRWQVKKFTHVLEHGSCIASDPGWTQVHTIGCSHSNPVIQRDRLGTGRRKPVRVSTVELKRARYWQVHTLPAKLSDARRTAAFHEAKPAVLAAKPPAALASGSNGGICRKMTPSTPSPGLSHVRMTESNVSRYAAGCALASALSQDQVPMRS